jgi:hypothetical protein
MSEAHGNAGPPGPSQPGKGTPVRVAVDCHGHGHGGRGPPAAGRVLAITAGPGHWQRQLQSLARRWQPAAL